MIGFSPMCTQQQGQDLHGGLVVRDFRDADLK
jgi:hypothetical protein